MATARFDTEAGDPKRFFVAGLTADGIRSYRAAPSCDFDRPVVGDAALAAVEARARGAR